MLRVKRAKWESRQLHRQVFQLFHLVSIEVVLLCQTLWSATQPENSREEALHEQGVLQCEIATRVHRQILWIHAEVFEEAV